ncbi:MAG: 3-deoxy-D-manno-octulosonic acid transferase, partial [Bacteroidia bacterium]
WNKKARLGLKGRKGNLVRIEKAIAAKPGKWLWLHAASLGEFEQGRPLIEAMREKHPEYRWLVTFFSPSGYEVRKGWAGADCVAYLPFDTPTNMRKIADLVSPEAVFIVKYELWLNWLKALRQRDIPTILVAASMQPDSGYFRGPFSGLYQKALAGMEAIFTQDTETAQLLSAFSGEHNIHVSGDPRYDRTRATREAFTPIPALESWIDGRFCLMGGSTWPEDEELLFEAFERIQKAHPTSCLVLAPHEMDDARMTRWEARYPDQCTRWTQGEPTTGNILWIDTIGMLAQLYHYAGVAYVGGGFRKGLHNILEAVAFGCPTAFGPQHSNRPEAADVMREGEGHEVQQASELANYAFQFVAQPEARALAAQQNRAFVDSRAGATAGIVGWWGERES